MSGATREGGQCKDKRSKDLTEAGKKNEKSKTTPPYVQGILTGTGVGKSFELSPQSKRNCT